MSALTPAQFSRRAYVLFAIMVAAALVITVRLGYWQMVRHEDLNKLAMNLRERTMTEYAKRGDIITGDGVLLATDIFYYEVAAHPNLIREPKEQTQALAPVLNKSEAELVQKLSDKSQQTVMLTLTAPVSAGKELTALRNAGKIAAIEIVAKPNRRYPGGSLAGAAKADNRLAFARSFCDDDGRLCGYSNSWQGGRDRSPDVAANA